MYIIISVGTIEIKYINMVNMSINVYAASNLERVKIVQNQNAGNYIEHYY